MVAHRKNGGFCLLPAHVAANQVHWSESRAVFRATPCTSAGEPIGPSFPAILRGDLYGLGTPGCGDPVVTQHNYKKAKEKA